MDGAGIIRMGDVRIANGWNALRIGSFGRRRLMTDQVGEQTYGAVRYGERRVSERGTAGAVFAAVLMIIAGSFGTLQGIGLIAKGSYYVQPANYWIKTSGSTWGWVHLIVGVVVLLAGFGVLSGAAWARWLGISHGERPGDSEFPVHSGPTVVVGHADPHRLMGHSRAVRTSAGNRALTRRESSVVICGRFRSFRMGGGPDGCEGRASERR